MSAVRHEPPEMEFGGGVETFANFKILEFAETDLVVDHHQKCVLTPETPVIFENIPARNVL